MATADMPVQLSWHQVDSWESQIADLQRKVEAAKVFLPARGHVKTPARVVPPVEGDEGMNFMGSVVEIANNVQAPISKAEMRLRLKALGAPEEKLGKTLDVTLYKTKVAKRITFKNGLISGAPK